MMAILNLDRGGQQKADHTAKWLRHDRPQAIT
jgi:hypothetical protein